MTIGIAGKRLVSQARVCGDGQKKPGHCCTHSVTTAGMLGEPNRLHRTFYHKTNYTINHIFVHSFQNEG